MKALSLAAFVLAVTFAGAADAPDPGKITWAKDYPKACPVKDGKREVEIITPTGHPTYSGQ